MSSSFAERYDALPMRDMARVTIKCLRRLGNDVRKMGPRRLTAEERLQLTEEDFAE